MKTAIVHISADEKPVGSYPAAVVQQLVDRGRVDRHDRWHCDGMAETLPVYDLLDALRPPPPVPFRCPEFSIIFHIVLRVVLALVIIWGVAFLLITLIFGVLLQRLAGLL